MYKIKQQQQRSMDEAPVSPGLLEQLCGTLATSPVREVSSQTPFDQQLRHVSQACKQLIVGLRLWARHDIPDERISDFYTVLVSRFNGLLELTKSFKFLDTSELSSISDDLRVVLEALLQEEASENVLQKNSDAVKSVIIKMLQGMAKLKQDYMARTTSSTAPNRTSTNAEHSEFVLFIERNGRRERVVFQSKPDVSSLLQNFPEQRAQQALSNLEVYDKHYDVFYNLASVDSLQNGDIIRAFKHGEDYRSSNWFNELRKEIQELHNVVSTLQKNPSGSSSQETWSGTNFKKPSTINKQIFKQQLQHLNLLKNDRLLLFNQIQIFKKFVHTEIDHVRNTLHTRLCDQSTTTTTDISEIKKLSNGVQELNRKAEELANTVEELRQDVVRRSAIPADALLNTILKEAFVLQREMTDFQENITESKPAWKKAWEETLTNVMAEQKLLKQSEEDLIALEEDYGNLIEIFSQIQQVVELKKNDKTTVRKFEKPVAHEGHSGIDSVMQEILSVEIDSDRRLKAAEKNETLRKKHLAMSRENLFELELENFVDSDKLRKTGGIAEVERLRRKRDSETLLNLFQQK